MIRIDQITPSLHLTAVATIALACAACGGSATEPSTTEATASQPRVSSLIVTPTLDVAGLFASSVAERIEVDEILINLAEVRMLGADPRIPAEGYPLLTEERLVRSEGARHPGVELDFPEFLLEEPELAVFMRIGRSEKLDGASVVVRGRYIGLDEGTDLQASQAAVEATDPDVDPMDDPEQGGTDCATDPDVDPMDCEQYNRTTGGLRVNEVGPGVPFELRDEQVVDLVTTLGQSTKGVEVLVGIPAARWITPNLIGTLEQAWTSRPSQEKVDGGQVPQDEVSTVVAKAKDDVEDADVTSSDKVHYPGSSPSGYVLDGRPFDGDLRGP